MNAQELKQLEDYLVKLTHVGYVNKEPLAAQTIAAAFSLQMDAPYLTVQRCLQLEQALAHAKARIAQLEKSLSGSKASTTTPRRPSLAPA